MMKIDLDVLFIHPRNFGEARTYLKLQSLEFCQMAGILKYKKKSYQLVDCNIDDIENNSILEYINNYNPKIILIFGNEINHINALELSEVCKNFFGDTLIGINGIIVTFLNEHILEKYKSIDFIVNGLGENVLIDILDRNCNLENFNDISNMAYRFNGNNIINKNKLSDLNKLPVSDRNLYDPSKYLKYTNQNVARSSWGCPSNCSFCNKTKFSKFKVKNMDIFFKELDQLIEQAYNSIFIGDDTFAFSYDRLKEFNKLYKAGRYSFKWTSNLRVCDIEENLVKLLVDSGAYRVFVGIESFNNSSLEIINKKQNITNLDKKMKLLKKYGLEYHLSFIIGNPGDSKDDIYKIVEFCKKYNPTLVSINALKLFPGTELFNNYEKYGLQVKDLYWFENEKWIDEQFVRTEKLSYEDIEYMTKDIRKKIMLSLEDE